MAFQSEQGVFDSQQQFLALVPLLVAEAPQFEGHALHRAGEAIHFFAKIGNGLLVRAGVSRRVEQVEDVFNELL